MVASGTTPASRGPRHGVDRTLDLGDGTRIHYLESGDVPPLLMLHGNPTWSFTWRGVIDGLRDRYRCIAVDLPGFGLSHAPASGYGLTPAEHAEVVERLVLELDLTGATLMCQDWGGPIGFRVATRLPDRFEAFVIGRPQGWPETGIQVAISP